MIKLPITFKIGDHPSEQLVNTNFLIATGIASVAKFVDPSLSDMETATIGMMSCTMGQAYAFAGCAMVYGIPRLLGRSRSLSDRKKKIHHQFAAAMVYLCALKGADTGFETTTSIFKRNHDSVIQQPVVFEYKK